MVLPEPHRRLRLAAALLLAMAQIAATLAVAAGSRETDAGGLPLRLRDTGLFVNDSGHQINPAVRAFTPQYPLWSDGAAKRRWLYLPPGTYIDARNPDAWEFPVGTRLWKEFAVGRAIETRFIERRADGEWQYATYVWNEDASDAVLAPARGVRGMIVEGAPGGRYDIPARGDCTACHEGAAAPVLGVSALQLSTARDENAVHRVAVSPGDIDLRVLVERGWVKNLPDTLLANPPAIAATNATERAALGYLHGNCGHCHNDNGSPAPVDLVLAHTVADAGTASARVLRSTVNSPSRFRPSGPSGPAGSPAITPPRIVVPAQPADSVLIQRMRSRHAATQMPPLGTSTVDTGGLALIERWISQLNPHKEQTP